MSELLETFNEPGPVFQRLSSLDSNRLVGVRGVNVGGLVPDWWDVAERAVAMPDGVVVMTYTTYTVQFGGQDTWVVDGSRWATRP